MDEAVIRSGDLIAVSVDKEKTQTSELIKIDFENTDRPTVLGRELHKKLGVKTPYHKWFPRMCEYGFNENEDYMTVDKNVLRSDGTEMPQTQYDHQPTIPMAKEICMIQRSEIGRQFRQYFIKVEEAWNTTEMIMGRALKIAERQLEEVKHHNFFLEQKIEKDKPKVIFANAVETSQTSILIGDLAKLIKQNGVDIGQQRLFEYLRNNGYLMKSGSRKNMPTQRAMEMKLFEIKERTIENPDGSIRITKTTKVTGKGQTYFINLFLNK